MPRACEMSWEGAPAYRWVRMYRGVRYRVSCQELGASVWTKEATHPLANEWWRRKLAELNIPTPEELAADRLRKVLTDLTVEELKALDEQGKAARMLLGTIDYVANPEPGPIPTDAERQVVLDRIQAGDVTLPGPVVGVEVRTAAYSIKEPLLKNKPPVPEDQQIGKVVIDFLAILARTKKAKSYREIAETLNTVKGWWAGLAAKDMNEAKVEAAFHKIAEMPVSAPTKKKRWGFVKRFVKYLAEKGKCDLPRNLHSSLLSFKVSEQQVKTWTPTEVRQALAALPEQFRLHALLGLNCGMTNVDMANLTKNMVKDGSLTRRRTKTGDHANVPTVTYRLWPETAALLVKFKSDHPELWLTSSRGTKLVEFRIVDGKTKEKDLIGKAWQEKVKDCPVPLFKFRSVAATLLESHPAFGRYVEHFLGHTAKSIKDKHYAAPSQDVFDEAICWLREQLGLAMKEQ
jgi:integrase